MTEREALFAAVSIQILFFIASLFGAYVVLNVLKGTANIKRKDAQFGGAAAMFIAIYWLLNNNFPSTHQLITRANAASQQLVVDRKDGEPRTLPISISPDSQQISRKDLLKLDNI